MEGVDKMKVLSIIENEDGSAIANVEINQEEQQWLIEYAFRSILQDAIEFEEKEKFNSETYSEFDLTNLEELNKSKKEDVIIDDNEDLFEGETDL